MPISPLVSSTETKIIRRIAIIGMGNVGQAFARYFIQRIANTEINTPYCAQSSVATLDTITVVGSNVDTLHNIQKFAQQSTTNCTKRLEFQTLERKECNLVELAQQHDCIIVAYPDDTLSEFWHTFCKSYAVASQKANHNKCHPSEYTIIAHCSGALPATVFENCEQYGCFSCSMHPCAPINPLTDIGNIRIVVETPYAQVKKAITAFWQQLGNEVTTIATTQKTRYHAAASIVANTPIALLDISTRLLQECGFDYKTALSMTTDLMETMVHNVRQQQSCSDALTGPVVRADTATVQAHLRALNDEQQAIAIPLFQYLLQIAQKRYPMRDYSDIARILQLEPSTYH